MSHPSIHTSVNFSARVPPSATSLQWSSDGQLFILTKCEVYIMTPNYAAMVSKALNSKSNSHDKLSCWFRTIIDIDRKGIQNWGDVSQDWAAVALGSLDIGLQTVAISPSGLTDDAGCVAAVLSSNMDLSLWVPRSNRAQGDWRKIQELTPLSEIAPFGSGPAFHTQVTSLTWSRQVDFGIDPAPVLDGSFLVLGTRGGTVLFFRFDNGIARYIDQIKVADHWVTLLAFSPWTIIEKGKCEAQLACGCADGSVRRLSIKQSLTSVSSTVFGPNYNVNHLLQPRPEQVLDSDKRHLLALTWIICKKTRILVVCKPGTISFVAPPSGDIGWSGTRILSFNVRRISIGSSPFHPVTGIYYVPADDMLVVCLSDGSIHAVHHIASQPSWAAKNDLSSPRLTTAARQVFALTKTGEAKYTDVNRISGLLPYGNQGSLVWFQEECHPTNFDYAYDSRQQGILVAATLWQCPQNGSFVEALSYAFKSAKPTAGAPIHQLGPFLLYLLDHREVYPDILRVLQSVSNASNQLLFDDSLSLPNNLTGPALRLEFRKSLIRYLMNSEQLLRLRMQLVTSEILLETWSDCTNRLECEQIASRYFDSISHAVIRILIHHIIVMIHLLTWRDIPFVLRLTNQALLSACPEDIRREARRLSNHILAALPPADSMESTLDDLMSESCPACGSLILLENGPQAICAKAHCWSRCSVTSFLLTTGMVQKCTVCNRKALLPLSRKTSPDTPGWLPKAAQSWIVEEYLEAASRCLFCGNIFAPSL